MDGPRNRRRGDREPRGFLPRAGGAATSWRRVRDWLFGDRADIDQQGLLVERTLMLAPPRTARDDAARDAATAGSHPDEAPL
jgi:hypothetical protein